MIPTSKWKEYRLDEIAFIQGGGTPRRSEAGYFGGSIPWVTPTDLPTIGVVAELSGTKETITEAGLANSSAKLIEPGSILFSSRASVGKIAVTNVPCATNQGFANFTPDPERIDRWFLAFLLCRYTREIVELASKTTFLEVPRGKLKGFRAAIPSLPEQRRIVACIKTCMERVEEIEECNSEISLEMVALYPSTLNELFGDLAEKCGVRRLDEVADIKGGGSLPKGQSTDPGRRDGVLLIKVGDMNEKGNERIVATSRAYLDLKSAGKKVIPAGAVLFPKRGGAIATNKKRMLGRPALVDPNMMAVIANPEHLLPAYLYYWTQTFKLESISNGGVIPQLNRKDLAPLEIPVPPIDEQKSFIFKMEQVEASWFEMVQTHTQAAAERAALREAILRKAFAGGL